MPPVLYVVVPCYNEEDALPETARRLGEKLARLRGAGKIADGSKILFVNDGSADSTWEIIKKLHGSAPEFAGIDLAKNSGHQNALYSGLMAARELADLSVSMDADLQDDIDAVDEMLEKAAGGCDIVYGVRSSRERDSFFKRTSAGMFYSLMRAMGAEIHHNHADYRLMNRAALDALSQFGEYNLFLRGLVPMIGLRSDVVTYRRGARLAGVSKYPLGKMLRFAAEGVTSLSIKPIRIISVIGLLFFLASMAMLARFAVDYFTGYTVPGWASTIVSIWAIGGLHLLAVGIIGEYVGKIYMEVKRRPRYIVRERLI